MNAQYGMTYGMGSNPSATYTGTSYDGYLSLARQWADKAEGFNATVASLTASVEYQSGRMAKLKAVKAKLDEAARLQATAEDDASKLGAVLQAATQIEGAQERANSLGSSTTLQVGEAQAACQTLIDELQGQLDALTGDLASAQASYSAATAKAASYRRTAASVAARERRH